METGDWRDAAEGLRKVMDGAVTDGVYGRALLQLVMRLPLGIDPVVDRYKAVVSIDYGDWDSLRTYLTAETIARTELIGMREILLAPIDRTEIPPISRPHEAMLFASYEYQFGQMLNRFRRWARSMLKFQATDVVWERPDVPPGRHFRYRKLQDAVFLALAEAQAGKLPTAAALALEAQRLGDEAEPLRAYAADLEELVALAMGDDRHVRMRFLENVRSPIGASPLGSWQILNHEMPLLSLCPPDVMSACVDITATVAVRFGSPRGQLLASSWRVATEMAQDHYDRRHPELPALLAQASQAGVGLRVLPQLLHAISTRRPADFASAESFARKSGQIWAQVSALTWSAALNPTPTVVRWLSVLLEATGWRRPVLVPAHVAGDAALGLSSASIGGEPLVEFASSAGRPNIVLEIASRHINDTATPLAARLASIEAVGTLGTARAQEILARLARRSDELGRRARLVSARRRRGVGMTGREVEVVRLAADGLTNRQIAERLNLSQHTVARHLANARGKLGAANRTEAAVKLEELEGAIPRSS
ncbi:MAG TPA: helix-turn-helix transcriptional regulator [Candidatus Limnocylindria bacterium]|nr:helix-turn-helix transcriptional regulator [Candidatus Limnocylindria bacterium]